MRFRETMFAVNHANVSVDVEEAEWGAAFLRRAPW